MVDSKIDLLDLEVMVNVIELVKENIDFHV